MESPTHVGNTRCHRTICAGVHRLIPTPVGNTLPAKPCTRATAVHPHACGEYRRKTAEARPSIGSSPRVWGILRRRHPSRRAGRFIPTRVGNTSRNSESCSISAVHPHACGEYFAGAGCFAVGRGSSPRVWGILLGILDADGQHRFIPTRVGNTPDRRSRCHDTSVHPHACGEYSVMTSTRITGIGSSPRVWGIRRRTNRSAAAPRFIPTRVGNTRGWCRRARPPPVHPHACGEYDGVLSGAILSTGSSPRVWGILQRQHEAARPCRFIPTRVGNTRRPRPGSCRAAVHPHACGEYCCPDSLDMTLSGSSPRVWGIRRSCPRWPSRRRFIPTRVGNTSKRS